MKGKNSAQTNTSRAKGRSVKENGSAKAQGHAAHSKTFIEDWESEDAHEAVAKNKGDLHRNGLNR